MTNDFTTSSEPTSPSWRAGGRLNPFALWAPFAVFLAVWAMVGERCGGRVGSWFVSPGAEIWRYWIASQTALWIAIFYLLGPTAWRVLIAPGRARTVGATAAIFAILGGCIAARHAFRWPGTFDYAPLLNTIASETNGVATAASVGGFFAALFPIVILFGVREQLLGLRPRISTDLGGCLREYRARQRDVVWAFRALSGMLVAATLSTEALWDALRVAHPDALPPVFVKVYGLSFTVVFVLAYAPVFFVMQAVGEELLDAAAPEVVPPTAENIKLREGVAKSLSLPSTTDLEATIAGLAPVISAILAVGHRS